MPPQMVHGYGGLRLTDTALLLHPRLAPTADSLTFRRLLYKGVALDITVTAHGTRIYRRPSASSPPLWVSSRPLRPGHSLHLPADEAVIVTT
mmetsp:Transcript_62514/g.135842  ORF Transcript_62514/g.135842 Transcript_62514/m.135842 type:complete len:92 (-) Transcript_62514:35-310(-)